MLKDIKNKLRNDSNCELDIEELKILYGINNLTYKLDSDLYVRDNYKDLTKIFGKNFVASTPSEITEETICYIGDLHIGDKLPTYNLKYIYGSLFYYLDKIYNLENLECITGAADFNSLTSALGLENLEYVYCSLRFDRLLSSAGLDNLKIIGFDAYFKTLKDARGLSSLVFIGSDANFDSLTDSKGLDNLEEIVGDARFYNLKKSDGLSSLQSIGKDAFFNKLRDRNGLKKLGYIGGEQYFNGKTIKDYKRRNKFLCLKK